jgi:membrane-associated phospholipid phosphatase
MKRYQPIYPIEIITCIWIFFTGLYILFFPDAVRETSSFHLLLMRGVILAGFATAILLHKLTGWKFLIYVRQLTPIVLIIYWYPETYYYNQLFFSNIDSFLIRADQWICGCQPSNLFSEVWAPAAWFNELMNFSYMSFYLAIALVHLYFLRIKAEKAFYASFMLLTSFLLYYTFYIFLPAEGPQFFLFEHTTAIPNHGPMRSMLLWLQSEGERPTGAVPSSHVGIMTVYMILLWKHARKFFYWLLPFSILLALSTVYIKAHYVIDMITGSLFAFPIYFLSNRFWVSLNRLLSADRTDSPVTNP